MPADRPTSFDETSPWVALMPDLSSVDIGIMPLSRPARPSQHIGFCDQIARFICFGGFVAEHAATNPPLPIVRSELAPDKTSSAVNCQQCHIFARPHYLCGIPTIMIMAG